MPAPITFGRYVLLDKLALGGMAEIFLAKAVGEGGFEKSLVIKRVLPQLLNEPGFVEMFLDEARIAAQLSHPGIVQIFDLGKQDGDYYFAMEYLAGEDVASILRKNDEAKRMVPVDVAVKIASSAAEALHYAHGFSSPDGRPMNIVHRDISPSNLFITYHGVVKVLDFGIARAEQRLQQTRVGHVKGKAAYMAPEQSRGQTVDRRADVWALGVCLHELLTGRRLFLRESPSDTLVAVREAPIPIPSSLRPEIPPVLDDLVMSALERDLARRTPNAEAVRVGLERYLADKTYVSQTVQLGRYLRELFGDARAQAALRRATASVMSAKREREGTERIDALAVPAPPEVVKHHLEHGDAADPQEQSTIIATDPLRQPDATAFMRGPAPTEPETPLPKVVVAMEELTAGSNSQTLSRTAPPGDPRVQGRALLVGGLVGATGVALVVLAIALSSSGADETLPSTRESTPVLIQAERETISDDAHAPVMGAAPVDEAPVRNPDEIDEGTRVPSARAAENREDTSSGRARGDDAQPEPAHAVDAVAGVAAVAQDGRDSTRPVSARPSPAAGSLTVRADAPVTVFLDGKRLGAAPIEGISTTAGLHLLRLENPALGISLTAKLQVSSGGETTRLFTFAKGKMNVLVDPWADVYVNGVKLGQTPLAGKELYEGRHRLRLVGPKSEKSVTVDVTAGKTTVVRESLP